MKRINLIPSESPQRRGERLKKNSKLIIIAFSVFGVFFLWQITSLLRYKTTIMAREMQIKELQVKRTQSNYAMERIRAQRKQINEARQQAIKRLALLQESREQGIVWSDVLIKLSEIVPEEIWLNDISLTGEGIQISGFSSANDYVSQFMAALDASDYFSSTGFNFIQKNMIEDQTLVGFEVTTKLSLGLSQ